MNDIVVIFRTKMYADIHRANDYLEAHDIPCFIRNRDAHDYTGIGQLGSGINPAIGEYEIVVGESDVYKASNFLVEIFPDNNNKTALSSPSEEKQELSDQ